MSGVYPRHRTGFEEAPETFVPELLDHKAELYSVAILSASLVNQRHPAVPPCRRAAVAALSDTRDDKGLLPDIGVTGRSLRRGTEFFNRLRFQAITATWILLESGALVREWS